MRHIQWIWILLFHAACNGCKQYEIPYVEDPWGAAIAINPTLSGGAASLGSINGLPVLDLSGTISKNIPGVGTAYLCALFVPDGQATDTGAKEIQSHIVQSNSQDASSGALALGKLHKLSDGSFVQYARPLGPDEMGPVKFSVASDDSDDRLVLGTTYNIYLGIKVGPHFFYTAGAHADYALPDAGAHTQVTMKSARCAYALGTNGDLLPQLSAEAAVINPPTNANTGFLFIKQGVGLTSTVVFAKQLAPGSTPWPTTPNTLTAHPDSGVVICPVIDANLEIIDVEDTAGILEKGATYDVYGYVEDSNQYFVSQNSCAITLPMVEIKVAMNGVENHTLIAKKQDPSDAEYDVSEFKLEVSGRIEKVDNAKNPVAGFVFVKEGQATDKADICQVITGSISNNSRSGEIIDLKGDKAYVVCIAKTADVGTAQTMAHVCDLKGTEGSQLDLTSDYRIYFWVKDTKGDGELFLSDNDQELKVFYVSGNGITAVDPSHVGNDLTIKLTIDISVSGNNNGVEERVDFVLSLADREKTLPSTRCTTGEYSINATNGNDLQAETEYQLSLAVQQGRVRYAIPSALTYRTPAFVEQSRSNPIVEILDGRQVELDFQAKKAYRRNENRERNLLDPTSSAQMIRAAIDVYSSNPQTRGSLYEDFGVAP